MSMDAKKKKQNKKTLAAGTAVVTAGALMVSGLFGEPAELLEEDAAEGIVESELMEQEDEEAPGERRSLRQRLRERILALPMALRLTVLLPLWALGWGLGELLPLFIKPLGLGAATLGAAAAAAKFLHPELPLRTLLSRRNFGLALLTVGLLYAANALLPLIWEEYERFSILLSAVLTLGTGTALLLPHARKEAEPEWTETMAEARKRVLEAVDAAAKH